MKLRQKLVPLAVASIMSVPAAMVATPASAEMSGNISVANMYLWRGQNLTPDGAQVSGGLDYNNASGFYAGMWTTSEEAGHETDLYVGFSGEAGGLGYDISFWEYLYPEDGTFPNDGLSDTDLSELVVGLSYSGVTFTAYLDTDDDDNADNNYYTLGYEMGKFGVTYGMWDYEFPGSGLVGDDEYSHLTLTYAATDELSVGVSMAFSDLDGGAPEAVEEDPLFLVSYSKSFDL